MSNTPISNLPAATTVNGTDQIPAVQSGTTVRITASQIASYINTVYPAPGVSQINTTAPISGGPITSTGTISLLSGGVTNSYLANMSSNTIKANLTGSTTSPSDVTPSAVLDTFTTTRGSILYRGSSAWAGLAPGSIGQVLTSNGANADPSYQTLSVPSGQIAPTGVTAGTYGSASTVPQFTVLASGQISSATNVSITIPYTSVTGLGSIATQNASNVAITGGTINSTTIGGSTPAPGTFTALTSTGVTNLGTIASGVWNGTAIGVSYGGTGATTAAGARSNLGAAASGANSDITSLSGLTTPLSEPQGGTGFSSYTTGDILYADAGDSLARLNDVATGNALISGGVGVAPAWGKIGLTTHVSGTLPVANGGTGATSLTGYVYGNGVGAFTASPTIPNAGLTNSSVTIGSTNIALGATSATLDGLTTVTLTQDPTAALQASTKQYVDGQVSAVSNTTFHASSDYATTANLTATYSNGTGGVGATLTNSGALAAFSVDGSSPALNSRILVKNQTTGAQNGIYTLTTVGSGAVAWVLTRATDFNTVGTGPNFIETGASTFVTGGAANGSTGWVMNTAGTIVVGTTSLAWVQSSSSASVTVTSPLTKVGSVISLGTVPTTLGGTGLTTLTQYNVMLGNGTGNVAFAAPGTTGYPLLSTGASSNPAFGQLSLTAGVTGTLPVANGGTGTATAFTTGSVVFAGASGTYSQNNTKFFWDNTNNRLGVNTGAPNAQLTILSNTQTDSPPSSGSLPAGTDIYIMGANGANTRITQDAYGTGAYGVFTARSARGTAAAPTASQADDTLVQFTARGYGTSGFSTSSVAYIGMYAAENFTDTAQGTYLTLETTSIGSATLVEKFRVGPSGQWGIFGASAPDYGTSGYVFTSGGASAKPTWSQVSATSLSGVLPVANGGTNISSYTIGDIIYASGTTTLSKLADIATGNVLLSGGVGAAPSYGKVGLTTHVSGTLPIANGGTALTSTPTDGQLLIGSTSGGNYALGTLTAGTAIGITNGSGSITINNTGVTSLTASTGISVSASTGGVTVTNTGVTSLTGGTAISVSASTGGVTINNTGVTSIVAGTNISISGGTGAVTVNTTATPTFATSITSPLHIGGTTASSTLTLQSTSGVGTTDSILFKVGNNGATTAMSIATGGTVTIGTLSLTNALPVASGGTGITAFGTGVATALGQNVTGSGGIVLATSPTLVTPNLGTPSAVVLTNATGLSLTAGVTGTLPVANGGTGVTTSTGTGSNVLSASPTFTGTLNAAAITASGAIIDSIGDVRTVPLNSQTTGYTLVATDSGKCISITTGGVTIPFGIFTAGQSVTIFNNSASSQTITQGASVTMYLVGTATTGNRTLAQRGLCTVFCVASNTFVITGGGLS